MRKVTLSIATAAVLLLWGCNNKPTEPPISQPEQIATRANGDLAALQSIVDAMVNELTITQIDTLTESYKVTLSDQQSITVKLGADKQPIPVIGVRLYHGTTYCWTVDTKWLTDADDNRIPAQSSANHKATLPTLKTDTQGFWNISYNGTDWERLYETSGLDQQAGLGCQSIFAGMSQNEESVNFTLAAKDESGVNITLSLAKAKDPTPPVVVTTDISSIYDLNTNDGTINSHANQWQNSCLEYDYSSYTYLDYPELLAKIALYPRIKKLSNGKYMLLYQQNWTAFNIYYAFSDDLKTWTNHNTLFKQVTNSLLISDGTYTSPRYSNGEAIVLRNGTILAFASLRPKSGNEDANNSGIVMRRSTDNGQTWSNIEKIWSGWNWEAYPLQLQSGEIQLYFTRSNPLLGDSGTGMLRSTDNGRTWQDAGYVARQKSKYPAIDGSGNPVYTDQMPVARELNDDKGIALAIECRIGGSTDPESYFHISMAYSQDNWATPVTVDYDETTQYHITNFIRHAGGPYLAQFPSGETVLTFNQGQCFFLIGDSEAHFTTDNPMIPFPYGGNWGSIEVDNAHTLIAAYPHVQYTEENGETVTLAKLQIARLVLNHRINATQITPTVDGSSSDWTTVPDALFIGSDSPSQAAIRFAYDNDNVYCLVERRDDNITADDTFELMLQSGNATGQPLMLTFTPNLTDNTIECNDSGVTSRAIINSKESGYRPGYVIETAIPRSRLSIANDQLLFNAVLHEGGSADSFFGLTATNYEKWLPVELKPAAKPSTDTGDKDSGTSPTWGHGPITNPWK